MTEQENTILRLIEERIAELKNVKQLLITCRKDMECMALELDLVRKQNDRLMVSLKDCANELCHKCGKAANSHLGSCDSCKWKNVKGWELDEN